MLQWAKSSIEKPSPVKGDGEQTEFIQETRLQVNLLMARVLLAEHGQKWIRMGRRILFLAWNLPYWPFFPQALAALL